MENLKPKHSKIIKPKAFLLIPKPSKLGNLNHDLGRQMVSGKCLGSPFTWGVPIANVRSGYQWLSTVIGYSSIYKHSKEC